jgi:hypothetical protein
MKHKSEKELAILALKICQLLDGLPMGQALWLVKNQVPLFLGDGHLVKTSNPRFVKMKGEHLLLERANS